MSERQPPTSHTVTRPSGRARALWRRQRSVELALAGHSYEEIAREVGYANRGTAWRTVANALEQRVDEGVEELRRVEGERLDALQAAVWAEAMSGDVTACQVVLRVVEKRIRLFGLDRPDGDKGSAMGMSILTGPG